MSIRLFFLLTFLSLFSILSGKQNVKSTCRHADIDAALARTSFLYDIDKLVCKYGMRVKNVKSTEEFMIVSGEDFVEKNLLSPFLKKPKEMIDVCILVGLDGAHKKLK